MKGAFEQGNYFTLKPNGSPAVKIQLFKTKPNHTFTDLTRFPLAKMYGAHTFEETPAGLKITTTMTVKGLPGLLWAKLVAKDIAAALPKEMAHQVTYAATL